ncbi:MAG TPA: hypothetical protein VEV62_03080, partial [Parafilimonas sp.]|nr:hypothetical protein [Parafilimonas sp.]
MDLLLKDSSAKENLHFFNNDAACNYYDENLSNTHYILNKSEKIKKTIKIGSPIYPQAVIKENNSTYPEIYVSSKSLGKRTIRIVYKEGKVFIDKKAINSTELKNWGIKMVRNFTKIYGNQSESVIED